MARLTGLNLEGDFGIDFSQDDHAEAKAEFERRLGEGYFAFGTKQGESTVIRKFDPEADEITLVRNACGG